MFDQKRYKAIVTAEQQELIYQFFVKRRKRQFLMLIPAVILMVMAFVSVRTEGFAAGGITHTGFAYIFMGLVILILVFMNLNWRCPACNGHLGGLGNPRTCKRCQVKLRKD